MLVKRQCSETAHRNIQLIARDTYTECVVTTATSSEQHGTDV